MNKIEHVNTLTEEKRAHVLGRLFNMGFNTLKGGTILAGKGARVGWKGVGKPVIGTYGKLLTKYPIRTSVGTGLAALSAPSIINKARGNEYQQMLSQQSLSPWESQMFGYKRASENNLLERIEKTGGFTSWMPNPLKGVKQLGQLFRGKGIGETPIKSVVDIMAAAAVPTIGFPLLSKTLDPSAQVMGQALSETLFPKSRRLALDDLETKEESKARAKAIGLENAKSLIAEETAKIKAIQEAKIQEPLREIILTTLKKEDPIIASGYKAPNGERIIQDTMKTVVTFAPTLSTDKKTVQSVLREALTSAEGGLSYQTIKQLAETQKSVAESAGTSNIVVA